MRPLLALASMLTFCEGCTQPPPIVLRNPATGEVRECRANPNAFVFQPGAAGADNPTVRACVGSYEAVGWQRAN